MTEEEIKEKRLSTAWQRLLAVRRCRIGKALDAYHADHPGEDLKVSAPTLKLVLADLARWEPGQNIYESEASIEHDTELSHASLVRSFKALVKLGFTRRKPIPGPRLNKRTELCWDAILAAGESYRPSHAEETAEQEQSDDADPPTPAPANPAAAPSADAARVAAAIRALKHVGLRICEADALRIAARFLAIFNVDDVIMKLEALPDRIKTRGGNPEIVRNPPEYLYKCVLDNAATVMLDKVRINFNAALSSGGTQRIHVSDAMRDQEIAFYVDAWRDTKSLVEFEISDPRRGGGVEGWDRFIEVALRSKTPSTTARTSATEAADDDIKRYSPPDDDDLYAVQKPDDEDDGGQFEPPEEFETKEERDWRRRLARA